MLLVSFKIWWRWCHFLLELTHTLLKVRNDPKKYAKRSSASPFKFQDKIQIKKPRYPSTFPICHVHTYINTSRLTVVGSVLYIINSNSPQQIFVFPQRNHKIRNNSNVVDMHVRTTHRVTYLYFAIQFH